MKPETKSVKLADITMDGGTQTRAALNEDAVSSYSEAMQAAAKFPPIVLFYDGSNYWLADGFHRCHAAKAAGFLDILATVNFGTRREAVKFAIQANHVGSVLRTNKDKRKCVEIALKEYPDLSDRALADWCGVSDMTVSRVRKDRCINVAPETPKELQDRLERQMDAKEMLPAHPEHPEHEEWKKSEAYQTEHESRWKEQSEKRTRTGKDGKQYPAPVVEPISPEEPAKKRGSYEGWVEFRDICDQIAVECDSLNSIIVDHAHKTAARDLAASTAKRLIKISNNQ